MEIACLPRLAIPEILLGQRTALSAGDLSLLNNCSMQWAQRQLAETNPDLKQIIPYLLVENRGKFAVYPRKGTEARLHGLYSAGIGGHIDVCDAGSRFDETIYNGLKRELEEEWPGIPADGIRFLGYINEEETSVGKVHLGLVFLLDTKDACLPIPGEELGTIYWHTIDELAAVNLELWSVLALQLVSS